MSSMASGRCNSFDIRKSSSYKVDAELGAELATMRNDAFAERLACGVVGCKRPIDIVMITECFGQGLRLGAGLGNAKAQMRARRRGRIADEHHATGHQAGRAEIVDWSEKRLFEVIDAIEKLRWQKDRGIGAHLCN